MWIRYLHECRRCKSSSIRVPKLKDWRKVFLFLNFREVQLNFSKGKGNNGNSGNSGNSGNYGNNGNSSNNESTHSSSSKYEKKTYASSNNSSSRGGSGGNKKIFLANLPFKINDDEIRNFFQKCGEITDIKILLNDEGKSKGVCFLEFEDSEAAENAVSMNGEELNGRKIKVEMSKPRERDGGGRGGSSGGDRGRGRGGRGRGNRD